MCRRSPGHASFYADQFRPATDRDGNVRAVASRGRTRSHRLQEAWVTATEERNLATIRAYFDATNAGNLNAMINAFDEDARNHGRPVGRAGVALVLRDIHDTFPDTHTTVEEIAAIGDQVVVRLTVSGTHLGVGRLRVNGGLLVGVEWQGQSHPARAVPGRDGCGDSVDPTAGADRAALPQGGQRPPTAGTGEDAAHLFPAAMVQPVGPAGRRRDLRQRVDAALCAGGAGRRGGAGREYDSALSPSA